MPASNVAQLVAVADFLPEDGHDPDLIANLEALHVLLDLWSIRIASGREQALVQLMSAQTDRPISSESIARVWVWGSIYRRQKAGDFLQILQLKVLLAAGKKEAGRKAKRG